MSNNMKSFSDARKAFQTNLTALFTQFSYTPTIFSMKINQAATASGSLKSVVSSEDAAAFLSGTKIPSLYAMYKITQFFNISIDSLLSSEPINLNKVAGKSFARQGSSSPKIINTIAPTQQGATMATKTTSVSRAKMNQFIQEHTTSTEYNAAFAYKVLNSDYMIKELAEKVSASPRALRDYMYYNTTVPEHIAKNLAMVLKTNTNSLGLKLNKETARYEHVK